jgi:hypothetical protein
MLLFLPLATFLIFFLILRNKILDWRRAALASAIFCAACVDAITVAMKSSSSIQLPAP